MDYKLLVVITPRTKRPKGMKQTRPMMNTTSTSIKMKGAEVISGCNIIKIINPMKSMLA